MPALGDESEHFTACTAGTDLHTQFHDVTSDVLQRRRGRQVFASA